MPTLNLGLLASHEGTNMQAIIDACKEGRLNAKSCVIISNNLESIALQRAKKEGIPWYHFSSKTHPNITELDQVMLSALKKHGVNLIVLVGYMKKLGPKILKAYKGKILNIHPALLPKFGGKGMYGGYVHEAVLAANERVTGVTIHIVNEEYDSGPIVNQCQLIVYKNDTVDTLSERVLKQEHKFFVETLQKISKGQIKLKKVI